jgi:transposase-like protein
MLVGVSTSASYLIFANSRVFIGGLRRTSNLLDRINKELRRRTRVATLLPNEPSLLRLVGAVLAEISHEWETRRCISGWPLFRCKNSLRKS